MNQELFDYIKSEIEYAEGNVGEAAFFAYDALSNGYSCPLREFYTDSSYENKISCFKLIFNDYHYVYEKLTRNTAKEICHGDGSTTIDFMTPNKTGRGTLITELPSS